MLLNIGKLRHSDSVVDWIDSAFLSAYFHDIDQLLTLERNSEERQAQGGVLSELPAKKGHALAAAVMMLTLHKRYQEEAVLRKRESWDICAGAAYMILKHDIPEELSDTLKGRGLPYAMDGEGQKTFFHGQELKEKFEKNELDLVKITPSQLIDLLRMVKKEHGFLNDDSTYGLLGQFEQEYRKELESLEKNERPLLERSQDENIRKSLDYMTEITVRADLLEMIAPPVEAIFRTLNTQYSKSRPFFLHEEGSTGLQNILEGSGNVQSSSDSDTRRILWEFVHLDSLSNESGIADSRYLKRVHKENAILGLLAFRTIGSHIMQGDMSDFRHHYEQRIVDISRKALSKAGFGFLEREYLIVKAKKYGSYIIEQALEKRGSQPLHERYHNKIAHLNAEMTSIITGLRKGAETLPVYTEADRMQFEAVCDRVLETLCVQHKVSKRELKRYKVKAWNHDFTSTTPYRRYDSIAGTEHIRTLIKPLSADK